MCLAIPVQLIECDETSALADLHGTRVKISTVLVPEVEAGDWVLVHAGFALQWLSPEDAAETFALLDDLNAHAEQTP